MLWHRHFILLLLAGTGTATLLAFPWLMSTLPAFGLAVAVFFSQLCHQNPERSFVLAGTTLPLCARCLALYLGAFAGIAIYPALSFRCRQRQTIAPFLVVSLGLMMLDAGLDLAGFWDNTFFSRSLTGALFGAACGLLLSFATQYSDKHHSLKQQGSTSYIHASK